MTLKRSLNPMPEFVARALEETALRERFEQRPPYQRNDYLGWISRAKRPATRDRRLRQMLHELAAGDRYMNMHYRPKK